jgi:uncharacterized protein (TIGR02246 family)
MKNVALAATITFALAAACLAQNASEASPEKTAALANARAYEAAYAKADLKALADFFTDDAEYTAENGTSANGRAQIEQTLRAGLAANRGGKLTVEVGSVRALSPEVVSEKGSTTVTSKSGEVSRSLYAAISVKKDGQWKISQLVESPEPTLTPGDRLAELEWLLGEWEESDKTNDLSVQSQYIWARGGNFLSRSVTVKRANEVTLEGWQVIGWDPVQERIRSWTFDGEGGFSEGTFTREGDRWLLRETGVAPDGSRTGWENTITKVSGDKFTLESHNRTLDGEPQPGIGRVEINRVKGN